MRDAIPYIRGEKQGRVVAITFDDGFRSVFDVAAPILNQYRFTATNYIVTNQIGGRNEWDLPLGSMPAPCMNKDELKKWLDMGHELGGHTLDHVNLNNVSAAEATRQIAQSREVLETTFDVEVSSFAYPYGAQSPIHRDIVRDAGYKNAGIVERRKAGRDDDPYGLPRITVRRADTLLHFLWKVLR